MDIALRKLIALGAMELVFAARRERHLSGLQDHKPFQEGDRRAPLGCETA